MTDPAQARHLFLGGCGLLDGPAAPWSGQAQWHMLETGFGLGLNFLATWHTWRACPNRPKRLFFSAIDAQPVSAQDIRRGAAPFPELQALANTLAGHWHGLLPGVHRLELDGGAVLLTLHIGAVDAVLPTLDAAVDSVFLSDLDPVEHPDQGPLPVLKAIARLCRPGARLVAMDTAHWWHGPLTRAGFEVETAPGWPPQPPGLRARFAPRWPVPPAFRHPTQPHPGKVLVVGGGLAGSAVACSLARRGWSVEVHDRAAAPAAGASGLPVGLVAPHVSPDDALLSRLSRSGVRLTLQRATDLLTTGVDWAPTGVLEHQVDRSRQRPDTPAWRRWGTDWSRPAHPQELRECGLPPESPALWHTHAGWMRPAALVRQQLDAPAIRWCGGSDVRALERRGEDWVLLDSAGQVLAQAPVLVLACAWATQQLLSPFDGLPLPLNPLRGQICWGPTADLPAAAQERLPTVPVNGHGAFVHGMAGPDGQPAWFLGSTFERGVTEALVRPQDRQANLDKLQGLLPKLGASMAPSVLQAHDWAGVRCTLPDRVPAVGAIAPERWPGLHMCAGLGARGLTLSVLCGELLAAQWHGEPWPTERKLAKALDAQRFAPPVHAIKK